MRRLAKLDEPILTARAAKDHLAETAPRRLTVGAVIRGVTPVADPYRMWRELRGCTFSDALYRAGLLIDGNALDRPIESELKHQLSATIGRAVAAVSNAGYLKLGVALLEVRCSVRVATSEPN